MVLFIIFFKDVSACTGDATLSCSSLRKPGNSTHVTRWRYEPETGSCNKFQYHKDCPDHQNAFFFQVFCTLTCKNSPLHFHEDIAPPYNESLLAPPDGVGDDDNSTLVNDDLSSSNYDDLKDDIGGFKPDETAQLPLNLNYNSVLQSTD